MNLLENVLPHPPSAPGLDQEVHIRVQGPGPDSEFLFSLSSQKCHLSLVLELEDISTVFTMHICRERIDILMGSGNSAG